MWSVIVAGMLLIPSWAVAQFEDCDSARNNGSSISRTVVSSTYNTLACSPAGLVQAEEILALLFQSPPSMSTADPQLQACWYLGYHQGAMTQLIIEYGQCEFQCIEVETIGRLSASVFVSLYTALSTALTPEFVQDVFQLRPGNTCTFGDVAESACQMEVASVIASAAAPATLTDVLTAQVCLEPTVRMPLP
jgi:hypothetical protein